MDANTVLQYWLDRSGEYSPGYYAYYGPNETSEVIRRFLDSAIDRDDAILELGCSSGRHLAHLHEHGYRHLSGIDINHEAADVMRDVYPDLAAAGTFHFDAIENVLTEFADGQFAAVFSVQTLQHIHHDNEWVFEDVARITGDVLVTVEIEGEPTARTDRGSVTYLNDDLPLYHRDWRHTFAEFGFVQTESEAIEKDTLRVFRPAAV